MALEAFPARGLATSVRYGSRAARGRPSPPGGLGQSGGEVIHVAAVVLVCGPITGSGVLPGYAPDMAAICNSKPSLMCLIAASSASVRSPVSIASTSAM